MDRQWLATGGVRSGDGHQRLLLVVDDVEHERLDADPSGLLRDDGTQIRRSAQVRAAEQPLEHREGAGADLDVLLLGHWVRGQRAFPETPWLAHPRSRSA
jgi:hypothetical protein